MSDKDTVRLPADFDAVWYRDTYPDVAASGLAPQDHYVRIGMLMGRSPSAARLAQRRAEARTAPAAPAAPVAASRAATGSGAIIDAPADLHRTRAKGSDPATRPGLVDGTSLRLGATEVARADSADALAGLVGPVYLYCRMMQIAPEQVLSLASSRGDTEVPEYDGPAGALCAGAALEGGVLPLAEGWFAADTTLRLMLVRDPARRLPGGTVLRAWQATESRPERLLQVGSGVLPQEGPGFCDLSLDGPLMPVLLELSDPTGHSLATALLPFPSLMRGGLHASELIARLPLGAPDRALWTLSSGLLSECLGGLSGGRSSDTVPPRAITAIEVAPGGVTGAEALFSPPVQNWLAAVFGLRLTLAPGTAADRAASPETDPETDAEADPEADPGLDWLSEALSSARALDAELRARLSTRRAPPDGLVLTLPADSVPTIGALVSRRLRSPGSVSGSVSGPFSGPFLVAEAEDRRPRWSVALPATDAMDLDRLQPSVGIAAGPVLRQATPQTGAAPQTGTAQTGTAPAERPPGPARAPVHLSIAFRAAPDGNAAALMMPVATDSRLPVLRCMTQPPAPVPSLAVALSVGDPDRARRALSLLLAQDGLGAVDVVLCPAADLSTDPANFFGMASLFAGRPRVRPRPLPPGGEGTDLLDRIATLSDAPLILTLSDTTLLHDPRTLQVLSALLMAAPRAASASCLMLRESVEGKSSQITPASGGLFPAQVSFMAAPQLIFAEPDCLDPLPNATWPVVANRAALSLIRRSAVLATADRRAGMWSGPDPVPSADPGADPGVADLRFGLDALAVGDCHLCTSAIRATTLAPPRPGYDWLDPLALSYAAPQRWDDILGAVTVLRDLT